MPIYSIRFFFNDPATTEIYTLSLHDALPICEEPKTKSMMKLIEKLMAIRSGLYKSVTAYYGREADIKPRLVIATRNVVWRNVDLLKCQEADISILADDELDYYEQLISHLHTAARYQFLAHIFGGVEVRGLSREVAATKGAMGGVNFYNFLIKPDDLLKIAYVGHKASRTADSLETYQRMVKPARLKNIAKYIDGGGKFPTNIVVNIKTKNKKGLRFDKKDQIEDSSFGTLTLPNNYASAWIIDGQHRLYGYAYHAMKNGGEHKKSALPVLAFENLSASDEMKMFIDINCEQVKVQKSLLIELYSDLHWGSPDPAERLLALHARVVNNLNTRKDSPVCDRVIVTGKQKTHDRCLTHTSISDGVSISRLLGTIKKDIYTPGPLAVSDPEKIQESLAKASETLTFALNLFANSMPEHWALGDRIGGYLCTNNAIRAIMLVIADICDHVRKENGVDLSVWTADEINQELNKYLTPVLEYFKSATPDQILAFRRQQALAGVKKQSQGMNVYIKQAFSDYRPDGLEDYISSRDQEGTDAATVLINQIQTKLFNYTINSLKSHFGEAQDKWWTEGIPYNVRIKCTDEWERQKRANACESYLYLLNYQEIALDNWELLGSAFALGNKDIGNRKKCVEWIKKLNDIRTITHHPEKGVLETDQINFVKNVAEGVAEHFPD